MIDQKTISDFEQAVAAEMSLMRSRLGDVTPAFHMHISFGYQGEMKVSYTLSRNYDDKAKGADLNKVVNETYRRYGFDASCEPERSLTLLTHQQEGDITDALDAQADQGTRETPVNETTGDQDSF